MNIDLSLLHSKTLNEIDISGEYLLPNEYYESSDILSLSNLVVDGKVTLDEEDHDRIICTISGTMRLKDSISLDEVDYPFCIKYDDRYEKTTEKSENILDIFQFLWENIVLEVPLKFTRVSDLSKFHGDGWKLVSEDELHKMNNPFNDLLKEYDKE